MFGISGSELLLIMVVILVVFGPRRLPEVARLLGDLLRKLRKNTDAVRKEFYNAVYTPAEDLQNNLRKVERELKVIGHENVNATEK